MKTWIDAISRIAAGMLFQGGYVTSPTMLVAGRGVPAVDGSRPAVVPAGSRRAAVRVDGEHAVARFDAQRVVAPAEQSMTVAMHFDDD